MLTLSVLAGAPVTCWAIAAVLFDFPIRRLRVPVAVSYTLLLIMIFWASGRSAPGMLFWIGSLATIVVAWLRMSPVAHDDWQPDVAEQPWAEIQGNVATIHNVRNFDYRTESDYTPRWETRTVDLSLISGVDLFLTHWGSPWIAHPIISFQFADGQYLAISIEARKRAGQSYSALGAFFRQFHVVYVVAEERDVIGLRTTYRTGERVRLYRTLTKAADARNLFMEYLAWIGRCRTRPEWYNALTRNCTTRVISYLVRSRIGGLSRYNWRTLLVGRGDEMLYNLGNLATDGLPFPELARKAGINAVAKEAAAREDFSGWIRQGRPGFANQK
jgi:uncharacterized protein DUF4105